MIIFFGPAGSGKSVQGQMLAARNGWRWLSAGQLLRDTHDLEIMKEMQAGQLVDAGKVNSLIKKALLRAKDVDHVILDGYPRELSQAEWLIKTQPEHERSIALVIVIEVPRSELLKRIAVRGRMDDTPDAVDERLKAYRSEIYPILNYFSEQEIHIVHIDGNATVGQVHDRIMEEVEACKLV